MFRNLPKLISKTANIYSKNMSKTVKNCGNIVWMDMEMTGLDLDKNRVIQIAMLVTDAHLNIISPEPLVTVIKQSDDVLDNMNDWCKENLKDIEKASKKSSITEEQAEEMMINFMTRYVEPISAPLAGNSIYMDRMFLRKYFPRADSYLHYRIIDVSSVKELCGRWNRNVYNSAPRKALKHRALEDITESINELKHYKENFFIVVDKKQKS